MYAVADPGGGGGATDMEYKLPRSAAIFYDFFYRPGGHGPFPPPPPPWIRYWYDKQYSQILLHLIVVVVFVTVKVKTLTLVF